MADVTIQVNRPALQLRTSASTLAYTANELVALLNQATTAAGMRLKDGVLRIVDDIDTTKRLAFDTSGISPATTRTVTVPNASGTMALLERANTWAAAQTIDLGTGALPAPNGNRQITLSAGNGQNVEVEFIGYDGSALLRGRRAGGVRGAETATPNDSAICSMGVNGHDGSGWITGGSNGLFSIRADGTWSGSNWGTKFTWSGTPNGSTIRADWMTLQGASLGLSVVPIAGNGRIQLATHTNRDGGVGFSTDLFMYRSSTGQAYIEAPGNFAACFVNAITGSTRAQVIADGNVSRVFIGSATNHEVSITSNGLARIRIGNAGQLHMFGGTPVARTTYGAPTGTATRTTFDTATVTLAQLAERVRALIDDFRARGDFA